MAESSSQEKTEEATPRRLREAREKGQVAKSKDVSQVLVLIVVFGTISFTIATMGREFREYFELCFKALSNNEINGAILWDLGKAGLWTFTKVLAPTLLAAMVVGFVSGFAQVGAIFAMDPLIPKFERLNPIEGLKNMFKAATFIELAKNIVKIILVFYLAYSTIIKYLDAVLMSSKISLIDSARLGGEIIFEFILKICVFFIFIALFDFAIQRWNFMKNMRMSKDDVKREYKQDEGDPHIKGERKRLHREMAFGDAKKAVKNADVVVTNPTHVACVLEYKKTEMAAPTLTAKGQLQMAEMIVEMARQENVPIIRNVSLAWSLVTLEVGDEITEEMFEAVAEVLTLVYEMKQNQTQVSLST